MASESAFRANKQTLDAISVHVTHGKQLNPYHKFTYNLPAASYNTCNLQPITAYRPIDGISPLSGISRLLTERVLDDRHHGRGAAHFLASFNY